MKKIVRRAYPIEVSAVILAFLFLVACFFTRDIFNISIHYAVNKNEDYVGMLLVGAAVVIAMLVMWEELLFPVIIKESHEKLKVRNHRRKLLTQTIIYLTIPAIFIFIYLYLHIHNMVHFAIWAFICIVIPIVVKIFSGLKNYNDYLVLSQKEIVYKNNEKEGTFPITDVSYISVVKDKHNVLHKLKVGLKNSEVIIDLDEMELEAYFETIQEFIQRTYKPLLR